MTQNGPWPVGAATLSARIGRHSPPQGSRNAAITHGLRCDKNMTTIRRGLANFGELETGLVLQKRDRGIR
ncbi:hypothetical protein ElyMa_000471800 [Elysia marginata]|uniref:Uncharacterized protein n=1 Tax=Elysia marginata TaxID=1093978 RepID=A0AAV4FRF7_9GAST|nr:hypothetical protein ElyMa_000471800 [Elysia marginata]